MEVENEKMAVRFFNIVFSPLLGDFLASTCTRWRMSVLTASTMLNLLSWFAQFSPGCSSADLCLWNVYLIGNHANWNTNNCYFAPNSPHCSSKDTRGCFKVNTQGRSVGWQDTFGKGHSTEQKYKGSKQVFGIHFEQHKTYKTALVRRIGQPDFHFPKKNTSIFTTSTSIFKKANFHFYNFNFHFQKTCFHFHNFNFH